MAYYFIVTIGIIYLLLYSPNLFYFIIYYFINVFSFFILHYN